MCVVLNISYTWTLHPCTSPIFMCSSELPHFFDGQLDVVLNQETKVLLDRLYIPPAQLHMRTKVGQGQ